MSSEEIFNSTFSTEDLTELKAYPLRWIVFSLLAIRLVGTIGMGLLLGFSSIWLRRNYYEVFLLVHISLSAVVLVGLFIHTSVFTGGYDRYLWPVVIVWLLDRIVRIIRLIYCNLYIRQNGEALLSSKGTASYDSASKLIRLEITPGSGALAPRPGQFYYIYQPLRWRGYESHPFTVGSWSQITDNKGFSGAEIVHSEERKSGYPAKYTLVFWIRPFDGWTRRLRSQCIHSEGNKIETTFLLEGPYGTSIPLYNFENVVLIAGGAGFAGVWPHIEDHMRRSQSLDSQQTHVGVHSPAAPLVRTKSITLVLASRQSGLFNELLETETVCRLSKLGVKIEFYSTSRSTNSSTNIQEPDENTRLLLEENETLSGQHAPTFIPIKHGRPNIRKILNQALCNSCETEAGSSNTNMRAAVLVCGPAAMSDETRIAVRELLQKERRGIEYYEEAFNW
ncbi:predicted protein [Uncinocarpus reesii 1704]|uniref:FAD-binding FR-type domain-containing protein n=1 Tax=Uncinocarpus reesii (strain UAMH 1704) TaxID=336963 RepID=C4JQQ1_UNCRE|nr:uncharacterized protein UREG_03396 [Uncinocarpus reesii 1704]EEP78550.1 predicted protein [Uncinocarpus reesii 1704]